MTLDARQSFPAGIANELRRPQFRVAAGWRDLWDSGPPDGARLRR